MYNVAIFLLIVDPKSSHFIFFLKSDDKISLTVCLSNNSGHWRGCIVRSKFVCMSKSLRILVRIPLDRKAVRSNGAISQD